MVSKSSAPHSIRFKNDLWAKVVAHAEALGITPNEAVVGIVEAAVEVRKPLRPEKLEQAKIARAYAATPGSGAQVPTFTRPAFNPQPKKGKK